MDLEHPLVVHPNTTHEEDVHTNSGTYLKPQEDVHSNVEPTWIQTLNISECNPPENIPMEAYAILHMVSTFWITTIWDSPPYGIHVLSQQRTARAAPQPSPSPYPYMGILVILAILIFSSQLPYQSTSILIYRYYSSLVYEDPGCGRWNQCWLREWCISLFPFGEKLLLQKTRMRLMMKGSSLSFQQQIPSLWETPTIQFPHQHHTHCLQWQVDRVDNTCEHNGFGTPPRGSPKHHSRRGCTHQQWNLLQTKDVHTNSGTYSKLIKRTYTPTVEPT